MDGEPFLLTISQIAVALAGFSGLVVATRDASHIRWHPRDIWSLSWMFGASIGALFLALFPIELSFFRLPEERIWTVANLVMTAYTLSFGAIMALWGRHLTKSGHRPRVPFFPIVATLILTASGTSAGMAAFGFFPRRIVGVFTLGLIACLLVSAFALVVFLVLLARSARSHPH